MKAIKSKKQATKAGPKLDKGHVGRMVGVTGKEAAALFAEVGQLYLDSAPAAISGLRRALGAGDLAKATQSAHLLKGMSGNLGAPRVEALAGKIEASANEGNLAQAKLFMVELEAEYEEVRSALAAALGAEKLAA